MNYHISREVVCPRCGGDLTIDNEIDGKDITCWECGYRKCISMSYDYPGVQPNPHIPMSIRRKLETLPFNRRFARL